MADPVVERMIELHKKLEVASREGSSIDGWQPLRIDSNGKVVAAKNLNGADSIEEFYPAGEWKKAYEYLKIQSELRSLLFSLAPEQISAYRSAVGLPHS